MTDDPSDPNDAADRSGSPDRRREGSSRRRYLAAVGTAAAVGLAGCGTFGASDPADREFADCGPYRPTSSSLRTWPMAFGGPAGTGHVAADRAPGDDLSHDWTVPFETHVGYHQPVVDDDTVYVHDADTTLFAVDAETGTERWRRPFGGPRRVPAVAGGRLIVVGEDGPTALVTGTGERSWRVDTGDGPAVLESPVVDDDAVYLPTGVGLTARSLASGDRLWTFVTGLPCSSRPAAADGRVYLAGDDTYVRALDAADGTELWRHKTPARVTCNVAVRDGRVVTASDSGHVYALDAADGAERWRSRLPGAPGRGLSVSTDGGRVYATDDRAVYALDAETGGLCWTADGYAGSYAAATAVADGEVFAPLGDGDRPASGGAYDAAGGDRTRRFAPPADRWLSAGPIVAAGAVYTTGYGGLRRFS